MGVLTQSCPYSETVVVVVRAFVQDTSGTPSHGDKEGTLEKVRGLQSCPEFLDRKGSKQVYRTEEEPNVPTDHRKSYRNVKNKGVSTRTSWVPTSP